MNSANELPDPSSISRIINKLLQELSHSPPILGIEVRQITRGGQRLAPGSKSLKNAFGIQGVQTARFKPGQDIFSRHGLLPGHVEEIEEVTFLDRG